MMQKLTLEKSEIMSAFNVLKTRILKLFRRSKAIFLIAIFNSKEVIFAHKFFLHTIFRGSISDVSPPINLKIGYWNKLQFKFIILARFLLKNQSWNQQWYEHVQDSILENLQQQNIDQSQLKRTLPTVKIGDISPREFWHKYVKTTIPIVIKGGAKHTYAYKNWTSENFIDRFGNFEVNIPDVNTLEPCRGTLKEVIESKGTERQLYAYSFKVFSTYPELFDELGYLKFREYMSGKLSIFLGSQLLLSVHPSTGSRVHCEDTSNLFFQIQGKKKWTLVHPDYLWLMYPIPAEHLCTSVLKKDDDEQYLNQYAPLHQYCPKYEVILEPGDILFVPAWMWHEVDNLTDETIAVATRWFSVGVKRTNTFFDLMQLLSPKVWQDQFYALSKSPDEPSALDLLG